MISRTVQIPTSSTSPATPEDPPSSSSRQQSDSFWNDGSSTRGDSDTHHHRQSQWSDAATVGSSPSRDDASSSIISSWLNISIPGEFDGMAASLAKSALMGAAAAVGYQITSAAARHVLRFLERRLDDRQGGGSSQYRPHYNQDADEISLWESLSKARSRPRRHLCRIIIHLTRKVQIRFGQIRASLDTGAMWPVALLILSGGSTHHARHAMQNQPWLLGPLVLGWLLCAQDGEDDNNDNDDGQEDESEDDNNMENSDRDFVHRRSSSIPSPTSASSNQTQIPIAPKQKQQRYLEMLVHNVSHTDLILGIGLRKKAHGDMNALMTPRKSEREQMSAEDDKGYVVAGGSDHATIADPNEKYALCRPRFSAFDLFTRRVLDSLRSQTLLGEDSHGALRESVVSFPRYERSDSSSRYNLVTPRVKNREDRMLPVGFDLGSDEEGMLAVKADEMPSLRVRGRDVAKVGTVLHGKATEVDDDSTGAAEGVPPSADVPSDVSINGVFFPLLSILLRRWHADIADKYDTNASAAGSGDCRQVKKVLILVSGVGSPRNWTHSITGNSTQACAELQEIFIKVMYPDVTVVRIHSDTNIFRYDENIAFVKEDLMPCVNAYRDAHARDLPYPDEVQPVQLTPREFDPDWKQSFSVSLSFADGSPARTHAIQTSLRQTYRPTYYHFWQLKTLWHDSKLSDEDIEVHPFEEMETVPAMDVAKITDQEVQLVIDEMRAFRNFFLETMDEHPNDIKSFWLRKTKKPVLAVLLVSDARNGGKPKLCRGSNMEVSMPTGSLCAERNVIGTALASNPGLKREDLKMVAVLAIPLEKDEPGNAAFPPQIPSPPPGLDLGICAVVGSGGELPSANSSLPECRQLLAEVQQKLENEAKEKKVCSAIIARSYSTTSFSSILEEKRGQSNSKGDGKDDNDEDYDSPLSWTIADAPTTDMPSSVSSNKPGGVAFHESIDVTRRHSNSITSPPGTPMRKIKLSTNSNYRPTFGRGRSGSKAKRTVVVHSILDINPLAPCGACNEWLKKIAESNPYFKVLTFTDADCNGVYITPVIE